MELRERGRGKNKRDWVIEMNHARRLYLSTYNGVDVLDHKIKNANMFYRTWKYWHAPVNHVLAIAIASAYNIYKEVAEGKLDSSWKVDKPVSYWEFRHALAEQALTYSPTKQQYLGDQKLRAVTKLSKGKRISMAKGGVNITQLKKLAISGRSRGCGDLDKLCSHIASVRPIKGRVCEWCGKTAHHVCTLYKGKDGNPVPLHFNKRGEICMCFWKHHNDVCIGLSKSDSTTLMQQKKKEWVEPTKRQLQINRAHILGLKQKYRMK